MPKKLCGMDLNGGFEGKSRLISVYSIFFFYVWPLVFFVCRFVLWKFSIGFEKRLLMNQYSPSDRLPARALSSEKVRVEKPLSMKYGIYILLN